MRSNPISGYDLAKSIFRECEGKNVDALVDFAGGETDWLEFKAGLYSRPEDLEVGERQEDALWHVARAVFGFLNSSGGLIILGIDDKRKPADLRKSERGGTLADEGMEAYLRKVVEPKLPPKTRSWNTGICGQWNWKGKNPNALRDAIEIRTSRYRGRDVVLVFVKPLPKGERQLVWQGERQTLLFRRIGEIAEVQSTHDFDEIDEWVHRRRTIASAEFAEEEKRFANEKIETILPKAANSGKSIGQRRKTADASVRHVSPILLPCPECGEYISVPGVGRNGNRTCVKCSKSFYCGVYEKNFVPQMDEQSNLWAVVKWLLLSFRPPKDPFDPVWNARLREELRGKGRWTEAFDFKRALGRRGLDVDDNDVDSSPFQSGDLFVRRALSNGGRIVVRYSTGFLRGKTRFLGIGTTQWIGLEHDPEGGIRVMDPRFAYGYLALQNWKNLMLKEVSAIDNVFSILP